MAEADGVAGGDAESGVDAEHDRVAGKGRRQGGRKERICIYGGDDRKGADRLERSDVPSVSAGRRREGAFYRPAGASQLYGDQRAESERYRFLHTYGNEPT